MAGEAVETDEEGEEKKKEKPNIVKIMVGVLKETTDFKLLKDKPLFTLITLSNFFVFFVYFIPFIYIPVRAQELGIDQYPWLISIIGIVNIPMRILFGVLADSGLVSAINMNTGCTLAACITLFTFYVLTNFWMQACFAVVFGMAIGKLRNETLDLFERSG